MKELEILGLQFGASKEEIKKAYHKMAHKYHPDKKGGNEAMMKKINEAYAILTGKRKIPIQPIPRNQTVVYYYTYGCGTAGNATNTFYW